MLMLKCHLSDVKHLTSFLNEILCWKYFLSKAFKILIFELKTIWLSNSLEKLGKPVSLRKFCLWLSNIIIKVTLMVTSVVLLQVKETYFENIGKQEKQHSMAFKSLSSEAGLPRLNPSCVTYHNCIIIAKLALGLIFLINKIKMIIIILYLTVVKIKWINTDEVFMPETW